MTMRSSVYEVLMYIFDHYLEEEVALEVDQDLLANELEEIGFNKGEVKKAFVWLETLTDDLCALGDVGPSSHSNELSLRIYSPQECEKLPPDSRGFLMFLEQSGVMDAQTRELVIDRALALESEKIDLEQVKWVALMVLFNQAEGDSQVQWIEDLVLNEPCTGLH